MCNCIATATDRLASLGIRLLTSQPLSRSMDLLPQRAQLRVERVDGKRNALPRVSASFCPFCGKKYSTETKETADASA